MAARPAPHSPPRQHGPSITEKDEPVVDRDVSDLNRRPNALLTDLDRYLCPARADVSAVIFAATANGQRLVGETAGHADPRSFHHEVPAAKIRRPLGTLAMRDSSRFPFEVSIQPVF
jgi:hypothetical protein